jgi:hypothetical protein
VTDMAQSCSERREEKVRTMTTKDSYLQPIRSGI